MQNHLELMDMQAEVLYVHDHTGRLTAINEPIPQPAPRFFWGQTQMGHVLRFRSDVPDAIVAEILQIMEGDDTSVKLAKVMRAIEKNAPLDRIWMGPAYA